MELGSHVSTGRLAKSLAQWFFRWPEEDCQRMTSGFSAKSHGLPTLENVRFRWDLKFLLSGSEGLRSEERVSISGWEI